MKPLSITAKRMLRRAVAGFCACACVFAVSACGADETGKIRIGIKFDQPGLGFKKNGTYVGFDVDVAKYVAKKLGYSEDEIVWKESPSKQREAMLQNGDVDYIVASYSITDERKKVVDFAGPYFVAGQDLLVRKDETGIDGPKDLNGKRLCSMTGTTSAVNVKEKFAKQTQLMEQPGMAECATALLSGIVDAATTDDIILAGLASASRGRLRVVGKPFTQEYYGIGVKKGNTELKNKINNAITDMIQDGSWQRAISDTPGEWPTRRTPSTIRRCRMERGISDGRIPRVVQPIQHSRRVSGEHRADPVVGVVLHDSGRHPRDDAHFSDRLAPYRFRCLRRTVQEPAADHHHGVHGAGCVRAAEVQLLRHVRHQLLLAGRDGPEPVHRGFRM